jgi:hypothetical protein
MLIDVILACAPAVVALPAVFTLLTSNPSVASKAQVEKRLYRTLLLAEKLPPTAAFAPQIARDIDRQTLHVAYVAQYPQRAREIAHLVLIGVLALGVLVGYYVLLAGDADFVSLLIMLAVFAGAALWLERALLNFNANDGVARKLFAHFGAPDGLVRPRTELIAKVPALTADAVFERAADVRDADHDSVISTLDAVNVVLAQEHSHFDWKVEATRLAHRVREVDYRAEATRLTRPIRRIDYRSQATGGKRRAAVWGARAYDWLLSHVVGPFFKWRLMFLDACERRRTTRAQRTGDVFVAAWLPTHYRNERQRAAEHWTHLQRAGEPLHGFAGNGHHAPAAAVDPSYRVEPVS